MAINKHQQWSNYRLVGGLLVIYCISAFVCYLTPNPFSYKLFYFKQFSLAWAHSLVVKTFLFQAIQFRQTVLILLIQFSITTDFVYTRLNVKTVPYITIQFSKNKVSMSKTVPFQTIQFSISMRFKCKYSFYCQKHFYFKLFVLVKQFYFK